MSAKAARGFFLLPARNADIIRKIYIQTTAHRLLAGGSFSVGDKAELSRTFSAEDVLRCAELTGDTNPLHLSPEFAQTTRYKEPIVHGVLLNG